MAYGFRNPENQRRRASWRTEVPVEAGHAAGEQALAALREPPEQGSAPRRRRGPGWHRASRGPRGRLPRRPAAAGTARNHPRSRWSKKILIYRS
jgi:hypothetical protein